jgi:hypothetical protein
MLSSLHQLGERHMPATASQIEALRAKAETGEQWAEICRLEAEQNGGPFFNRSLTPREEWLNDVARWAGEPGLRPCPICNVALSASDTTPCGNDCCPLAAA